MRNWSSTLARSTSFETNGTISGMSVGTGVTPTDVLDLTTINSGTIASAALGKGGAQIELFNSGSAVVASFNLDTPAAGAFVHWTPDEGSGTNVFLSDTPVCFAAGTHILTARGEVAVEHLTTHDAVVTLDNGKQVARPVKWLGRRRIDLTAHPHPETVAPIRILRGTFAENVPHRDLVVSPDHAVFADDRLICARQLINGTTIRQEQDWNSVDYFHVELDAHAILLAEGLPTESYLNTGNRGFFANSDQPLVLHPDLTDETDYPTREAGSCAPFVWDEDNVRAGVAAPGRACGGSGPSDRAARHHDRCRTAHRGQRSDLAAAASREGFVHLRFTEGHDRGVRDLACGCTERRAAMVGGSPLPRRVCGADRAAWRG